MARRRKTVDEQLDELRHESDTARIALYAAVVAACPSQQQHHSVQHRDGKPAWCRACGRDDLGRRQKEEGR